MLDILSIAKDLIKKGKLLGDPELIQMGYDMLEEPPIVDEVQLTPSKQYNYVCSYCGQNVLFDTPNRKKCPKCKKHQLTLIEQKLPEIPQKPSIENFAMQIRNSTNTKVEGRKYARIEQVEQIKNVWSDNGKEGHDEEDDRLKQIKNITPRKRPPMKMVDVICDGCKKTFSVHPIHVNGRERYLCDRCITRRGRM